MKGLLSSIALAGWLLTAPYAAAAPDTDEQRFAYSFGATIAEDMQENLEIENLDLQALGDGMRDVFDHNELVYGWPVINTAVQQGPGGALDGHHLGYSYGATMAQNFMRNTEGLAEPLEVDIDAFIDGMRDVFAGNALALSRDEIGATREAFEARRAQTADEKERLLNADSEAFLARNAQRDGVIETDAGFQFEKLESGSGASPGLDDSVEISIQRMNPDGTESGEPASTSTYAINEAQRGFKQLLPLMRVGDVWMLYTPAKLDQDNGLQLQRVELLSIE
ncbi:FKBP-type peptidyl-prolyl cis-trans isomerase N-terminal domain-containing protein [Vreelandella sp. GE22]